MNKAEPSDLFLETERYELSASPLYHFETSRREFFKTLGCGLVVLFLIDSAFAQESGGRRRSSRGGQRPAEISAWLHIGEDGMITVFTGKAEMGQNIRTSLTQAVAEELRAPVSSIRLVMADTQLTPYDAGTFGSRTTPDMASQLHKVSAAAREALLELAAEHFKTDRTSLVIADGRISQTGTDNSINFGQLTKGQKLVKSVDDKSSITGPDKWKIAGTSAPKVDGQDFVTGKHQYASDVKLPGMLHGKVLRPSAFEATLDSLDTKPAEAMPGVTVVHEGNFIGVVAPDIQLANRALAAIEAKWTAKSQPSSTELFDYLKKNAVSGRGSSNQNDASIQEALSKADHKFQQTYTIAYIAHAPLEPRAAVAEWKEDKLTVWTGTQRPFGVRGELAEAFGIAEDHIRVIVPDTGSAYGGKHTGEVAVEAARLSKSAGKPVKLVWTREEEFTWAYFRPAGIIDISSGVRNDGTITAWEFHNYNSGGSGISTPYEIEHQQTEFHSTKSPLRQGSYRGLAATANHFAREMQMDEMAHAIKMDPLEFRLKNLKDSRMRAVLEAAAKTFGWAESKAASNHGFGIAVGTEKGSYVATCAEVSVDRKSGKVQIIRAVTAFECGAVVNPEHLKNQIEGAMVMGLGGALFEAIQFENGKIKNPHFSSYRVPRFSDVPEIEVVLVDRKDLQSAGAGETPIIGIAPAIGNAIFNATGVRLRSLPMSQEALKS
ncbi:xanthine dehydrogenase family protein molybdopterin-binding subunit [Pedosphaera parvula]|uniref:Aldehyde oxidase and xanthine dehydrogenase molybdopterin binding n=1 Tax=Pedosphaera parvula (strain Ellin514) TaxID=320771 RepID=B9XC03_PEDPL|nr:molybdopterin cofactor-binding domain-containing protein [Pedosphaera parvula]EEF62471.1 aldehyde oxidase and xanthine dehydrogenase molybdopterin binding [Pedosphaera parvula Ellin514]